MEEDLSSPGGDFGQVLTSFWVSMRRVLELCRLLTLHLWIRHLDSKREIIWQNGCDYHSFNAFCSNALYVITLIKRSWWESSLKKVKFKMSEHDIRYWSEKISPRIKLDCWSPLLHLPLPIPLGQNQKSFPCYANHANNSFPPKSTTALSSPGTSFKFLVLDIVRSL